jgi:AcrR family transcriptional regulator
VCVRFNLKIANVNELLSRIHIQVDDKIYLKDPNSSDLGKSIVKESVLLIDEIGLENFTFRKLAQRLQTTESSIYRYFENKHRLLIYLTSWYWVWMEYRLVFSITNLGDSEDRLRVAIHILNAPLEDKESVQALDLPALYRIVISESSKAYLTKDVRNENREGLFSAYKQICKRLSGIMAEVNPDYPYPNSLSSTLIESVYHQKFLSGHLPALTDLAGNDQNTETFFTQLVFSTIKNSTAE